MMLVGGLFLIFAAVLLHFQIIDTVAASFALVAITG